MDKLDQKLIAAWNEIPAKQQVQIRKALAKPHWLGALMPDSAPRELKTTRGYVVSARFVTPLARELIEAVGFNTEPR